jgi:hypothetical protein
VDVADERMQSLYCMSRTASILKPLWVSIVTGSRGINMLADEGQSSHAIEVGKFLRITG